MYGHKPEGLFVATEKRAIIQYFQINHLLTCFQFDKVHGFIFVLLRNSFHRAAIIGTVRDSLEIVK